MGTTGVDYIHTVGNTVSSLLLVVSALKFWHTLWLAHLRCNVEVENTGFIPAAYNEPERI